MFKKFISYYRNHLGLFILDMIAALLMAGIDLVYPYFTGIFICLLYTSDAADE